jgi:hypothetical protein
MRLLRRIAAIVVAGGLTLGVGALSNTTLPVGTSDSAMVRLAWRATPARIRRCRMLTPAELARIPAHMRRTEECEEATLPYRLTFRYDSAPPVTLTIHAAGAREDRPMYVFHESRLGPGPRVLSIRFQRDSAPDGVAPTVSQTPALLTLDTVVVLRQRQIALVTYDADRQQLVLEASPSP